MQMSTILTGEILEPEKNRKKMSSDEKKVRRGFWKTVHRAAAKIPFMEDVVAAYYCALDPATPSRTRAILLAALAYFVLPLDWVPDFIMGFGFTDDIAVLSAALAAIRTDLQDRHYHAAHDVLSDDDTQEDASQSGEK
jgi:uncharacterized membrane protein YkvA (DUF1232 family)